MATLILLFLRLSLCCAAFSWPRQNTAKNPPVNDSPEEELVGLLASHDALENYYRFRPDCFRRVAAKIRLRCGELEMNEDERVRAAISMTLCELATATHHSLPLNVHLSLWIQKRQVLLRFRDNA
ncbi:RING finger protein [Mycena venus]|uniref:RING finger protein n=1 Tax=Mycena venus TaxID=2733690 RepID=A0A8H6U0K2_9AGAR|nr:RING finger protein [Mycena venus]